MFNKDKCEKVSNPYILKKYAADYPASYYKLLDLKLVDFDVWYLFEGINLQQRKKALKQRYRKRQLLPFARRDDNDDIACFEIGKGDRVQIIHDFSSSGYEQRGTFPTLWAWVRAAITDLEEYYDGDYSE